MWVDEDITAVLRILRRVPGFQEELYWILVEKAIRCMGLFSGFVSKRVYVSGKIIAREIAI